MSSQLDEAAREAAAAIMERARGNEASPEAPQEAEPVAETQPEAEIENEEEELSLEAELPDDLEDDEEYALEDEPHDEVEDEYLDPEVQEERNKRIAAEKRLRHIEAENLKRARKEWVAKDGNRYLLADVAKIAAESKSRREFNRKALDEHNRIKSLPGVQNLINKQQAGTQTREEQLVDQWGKPSTGPGLVPSDAQEATAAVDAAFKRGGLAASVKEMLTRGIVK